MRKELTAITLLINSIRLIKWSDPKIHSIIPILSTWWVLFVNKDSRAVLLRYISILSRWFSSNGKLWTIDHVKTLRLFATRWMAEQPITDSPYRVKLDKSG